MLGALVARRRLILNSQNDNGCDSFLLSTPANEDAKKPRYAVRAPRRYVDSGLTVFRGAPLLGGRSDKVRVRIAPTAIACQHIRSAFFNRAILAVPMHVAVASRGHRAPGSFPGGRRLWAECERSKSSSGEHDAGHHQPPGSVLVITPENPLHSRPHFDISWRRTVRRATGPRVRFGSFADICSAKAHVRFTPESRHSAVPGNGQMTRQRLQARRNVFAV